MGRVNSFERDEDLRSVVLRTFSTNHGPEGQAACLSELFCCLPRVVVPSSLSYKNVFRVLIVQFMDAQSLDIRSLKKSCIHFVLPDGRMIPFESYNLFYRDEFSSRLASLRREVEAQTRLRAT
jgi:hypothetical protein